MLDDLGKVIVLISADVEWRVVRQLLPSSEVQPSPYGEWFTIEVTLPDENRTAQTELPWPGAPQDERCPVIFFHGGWGKIAAAASTQYVIDRWKPRLLINLGTCGGFEGQVEQGDVIVADKTVVYDIVEQMGDFDAHIAHYSTTLDTGWLDETRLPFAARRTLLVSGDRDLLASEIPELHRRYGAVAGDWESGAIAWVADRNHIPLVILRGVSDVVRSLGSEAYGNLEYFAASTERIMQLLIAGLPACLTQFRFFGKSPGM